VFFRVLFRFFVFFFFFFTNELDVQF